ncbi:MAG: S8 family serine peptidase [Myxococcales bacterium]|nr:S8 family serine peptidase [Myxococcales bacterium]
MYEEENPVLIDATGAEISLQAWQTALFQHNEATYGTLEPELHDQAVADPARRFFVAVYPRAEAPLVEPPTAPYGIDVPVWLKTNRDSMTAWVASANAPVVSLLGEVGATIEYVSQAAPIVYAVVPGTQLLSVLKASQVVDHVESAEYKFEYYTTGNRAAKLPDFYAAFGLGDGVKIAIVDEAMRVHSSTEWHSQFIAPSALGGTSAEADPGSCQSAGGHGDLVAGVASGNYLFAWSGAYRARVLSANSCVASTEVVSDAFEFVRRQIGTEFALQRWQPEVYNHSYGEGNNPRGVPVPLHHAMDFRVRQFRTAEVQACGNAGASNFFVGCAAFNTLQVGGIDDMGTGPWPGDRPWMHASTKNPQVVSGPGMVADSDRELPAVAASAQWVSTADATQASRLATVNVPGTSFAAPRVSALVALLKQQQPWLGLWPEVARAALMATSVHRKMGAGPLGDVDLPFPEWNPSKPGVPYTLDLKVGFGGVSGKAMARLLGGQGRMDALVVRPNQFFKGRFTPMRWHVGQAAGRKAQFVFAYSSATNCNYCNPSSIMPIDGLAADFDLVVQDINGDDIFVDVDSANSTSDGTAVPRGTPGSVLFSSLSFHSSFEALEIDFDRLGLAEVWVQLRLFGTMSRSSESIGVALYQFESWEDEAQ